LWNVISGTRIIYTAVIRYLYRCTDKIVFTRIVIITAILRRIYILIFIILYIIIHYIIIYYYRFFCVTHESTTIIVINYRRAGKMLREVFRFCRKRLSSKTTSPDSVLPSPTRKSFITFIMIYQRERVFAVEICLVVYYNALISLVRDREKVKDTRV